MQRSHCPEADLHRRRAAFADMVIRADLAPPAERERLLNEAVTSAYLHHAWSGTPLVPDLDAYPGLAERLPQCRTAAPDTIPPTAIAAD